MPESDDKVTVTFAKLNTPELIQAVDPVSNSDMVRCLYIDKRILDLQIPFHEPLDPHDPDFAQDMPGDPSELLKDYDPCQDLLSPVFAGKVFRPQTYGHNGRSLRDDVQKHMAAEEHSRIKAFQTNLISQMNEYARMVREALDAVAIRKNQASRKLTFSEETTVASLVELSSADTPKEPLKLSYKNRNKRRCESPAESPKKAKSAVLLNDLGTIVHASGTKFLDLLSHEVPVNGIRGRWSKSYAGDSIRIAFSSEVKITGCTLDVKKLWHTGNMRKVYPNSEFNTFKVFLLGKKSEGDRSFLDVEPNTHFLGAKDCAVIAYGQNEGNESRTIQLTVNPSGYHRDVWVVFDKLDGRELKFVLRGMSLFGVSRLFPEQAQAEGSLYGYGK